jgi:hypothetical protein
MAAVARLVTFADVADPDAVRESVQCRHVAVLADGRRFVLLDECWCSSGTWAVASHEEIEATARAVFEETPRWSALLRERGIATGGDELEALPHDVVLTDRLRARVT